MVARNDRWIVRTGVGWSQKTVVIEDGDGDEIAEMSDGDEQVEIAQATAIVAAHNDQVDARERVMALECEVERWQESTSLSNGYGDPEGIGPEANARNIEKYEAEIANLKDALREHYIATGKFIMHLPDEARNGRQVRHARERLVQAREQVREAMPELYGGEEVLIARVDARDDEIARLREWAAVALGAVQDVAISTGWGLVPESGLGLAINALLLGLDTKGWDPKTLAWLHRLREIERAATHMGRVMGYDGDMGNHGSNVISEAAVWLCAALEGTYTANPDLSWWEIVTARKDDDED